MITFRQRGDFSKMSSFLERTKEIFNKGELNKYGEEGVAALSSATPRNTGLTADSWKYKIERNDNSVSLSFYNTNLPDGVPVAIILQTGHATPSGGWVEGIDYINPALEPIFNAILDNMLKELG